MLRGLKSLDSHLNINFEISFIKIAMPRAIAFGVFLWILKNKLNFGKFTCKFDPIKVPRL
jgi:hypothetical protein